MAISVSASENNYKPDDGYIPNAETAIKIAIAVWEPIYGKKQIQNQAPYRAKLNNGIWTVTGSLPGPQEFTDSEGNKVGMITAGGVALIEIEKDSGCILRVIHGE